MPAEGHASPLRRGAELAPFLLFLAIYLPTAGHGFIRDDYQWVLSSRVHDWRGVMGLFHQDNGFYRPLVSLTFMFNGWMFGASPLGFGITNVLLALSCSLSIIVLARSLGLPRGAAVLAGALWLLNPRGVPMAVLWISGRTSLLVTLVATLASTAWVRGRGLLAGALLFMALMAKEEAALLPLVLLVWWFTLRRGNRPPGVHPWKWIGIAAAVEAVYLALRSSTHAMTPWTAPSYYRFVASVSALLRNALEYADRTTTFSLFIVVLALACLRRTRPLVDTSTRAVIGSGAVWIAGTIAPTILLPVRSDLYACLPSVGVCFVAAAICGRLWENATPIRRRVALVSSFLVLMALAPVYYLRTNRYVSEADLASVVLADLTRLTERLPDESVVVIDDDRTGRANVESAFQAFVNDAFYLAAHRRLKISIEPPRNGTETAAADAPCAGCVALRLRLSGGHLHGE